MTLGTFSTSDLRVSLVFLHKTISTSREDAFLQALPLVSRGMPPWSVISFLSEDTFSIIIDEVLIFCFRNLTEVPNT